MAKNLVFVYGTLKRGFPNSHYLADTKFVGEGKVVDKYPLVIASRFNIPYILLAKNLGYQILGEVYDVTDPQLKILDALEGHPDYYNRIKLSVVIDSSIHECITYVLARYKDSLLKCNMLGSYSMDDASRYVKPCDRRGESGHKEDVMDYSK